MTMATAEQHQEISVEFLSAAEDEFRKGEILQAGEKAWGAVSHYVNSIALRRGWPIGSHRRLIDNVNQVLARDPARSVDRRRLLRSVEALHANFYQAFLDEDSVRDGINDAKELIDALETLSSAP